MHNIKSQVKTSDDLKAFFSPQNHRCLETARLDLLANIRRRVAKNLAWVSLQISYALQ